MDSSSSPSKKMRVVVRDVVCEDLAQTSSSAPKTASQKISCIVPKGTLVEILEGPVVIKVPDGTLREIVRIRHVRDRVLYHDGWIPSSAISTDTLSSPPIK